MKGKLCHREALVAIGASAAAARGALYHAYPVQMATLADLTRNYIFFFALPQE
jgi:hypothetical protein